MPTDDLKHWIRTELWDQVPVSIAVINRDFDILEANKSFVKTYGRWQNRKCYAVYKGRSTRCEKCAAAETFADGRIRVREEEGVLAGEGEAPSRASGGCR
jgi:histidine kinase